MQLAINTLSQAGRYAKNAENALVPDTTNTKWVAKCIAPVKCMQLCRSDEGCFLMDTYQMALSLTHVHGCAQQSLQIYQGACTPVSGVNEAHQDALDTA